MTINTGYSPNKYVGNGVTTDFSIDWNAVSIDFIKVVLENRTTGEQETKTLGVDYTATITDNDGIVSFMTAPSSSYNVILSRNVSLTQEVSYSQNNSYRGTLHEDSLDKIVAQNQQQAEELGRSAKLPLGSAISSLELPTPEAKKTLVWNDDENALINSSSNIDEVEVFRDEAEEFRNEAEEFRNEAEDAKNIAVASADETTEPPLAVFTGDGWRSQYDLTPYGFNSIVDDSYDVTVDGMPQIPTESFNITKVGESYFINFAIAPQSRIENIIVRSRKAIVVETTALGGNVASVNGMVGEVVLTTDNIENTSSVVGGSISDSLEFLQTEVSSSLESVVAGENISVDNSDALNPVVSMETPFVESVSVIGDELTIDNTDAQNPILSKIVKASVQALSFDTIPVTDNPNAPTLITGLTGQKLIGISITDANTGTIRNDTGRTISMAGSVSYNPKKLLGGTASLYIASEQSSDGGATWVMNPNSGRKIEIDLSSENFGTKVSEIIDWQPNNLLRFVFLDVDGAGLQLESISETIKGQTVNSPSFAWTMQEV